MDTIAESPNYVYHATTALGLAVLIGLYLLGTWSRAFVMPIRTPMPVRRQMIATVPVGCITMSVYAKSAFPALTLASQSFVMDCGLMLGYAMILGMLSRETLERLLLTLGKQ